MLQQITINHHSLTVDGLSITYAYKGETTTLSYDAKATAALLVRLNAVEAFDIDRNNEPVILFTDRMWGKPVSGFTYWHELVKTFPIERYVHLIAEEHQSATSYSRNQAIIKSLLPNPLKVA